MAGLYIPPSVRADKGGFTMPNPAAAAGSADKVLTVKSDGSGYELRAAGGGGASNPVQGFNRARPSTMTNKGTYYSFSGWSWDPTWSNFGWSDPNVPPQLLAAPGTVPDDQGFSNRDAGWFCTRVRFRTDSTAAKLDLRCNIGSNAGGVDTDSYYTKRTIFPGSDGTYDETVWVGPFWLPAGNVNYAPFLYAVNFTGSPSFTSFRLDVDVISGAR